ncbi:tetratricopeptide repeat protein [Halopseudomonas salina]|nr:sel1 repeat family protein [Halopseudomonas salina]
MRERTTKPQRWLLILMCFAVCPVWAELTPEQQAAKEHGSILYRQFKAISAEPYLTIAAEAGDAESQFLLAEALRKNNRFMTPEAYRWLEASAEQDNSYAMIRLGRSGDGLCAVMGNCSEGTKTPEQWLAEALQLNEGGAAQGDPEAMYLMYKITLDREWLKKASEAGHALAQYWLAGYTEDGMGLYLWPGSRQEAVKKWYKASAEGGYPLSMKDYATILLIEKDYSGYRYWIEKVAETGYVSGVYEYSMMLIDPRYDGYKKDMVKGYGLLLLFLELEGGGFLNKETIEKELPQYAEKMTAEQLEQAREFAAEWKATHPPLSFFPQKLDPSDTLF